MSGRIIKYGSDARKRILQGMSELEEAVISTLGPKGRFCVLHTGNEHPTITKDGVSVARFIHFSDKYKNIGASIVKEGATKTNSIAGDGPQPLNAKVLTPYGFAKMSEIKPNRVICGTDNSEQLVLATYNKGKKKLFKVNFEDGSEVECSDNHLWNVTINDSEFRTITTSEIIGELRLESKVYTYHSPVEFKSQPIFKNAEVLVGLLLQAEVLNFDKNTYKVKLISSKEKQTIEWLKEFKSLKVVKINETGKYNEYELSGSIQIGKKSLTLNQFIKEFRIKLYGIEKVIPSFILYTSRECRERLIKVFESSICYDEKNQSFIIGNKSLSESVEELLSSLGYVTKTYLSDTNSNFNEYNITYKKKDRKEIVSIIATNEEVEMMCIKVSNPDHLYITDGYNTTHNTTTATLLTTELCKAGNKLVDMNLDSIEIKKGFDLACVDILAQLDKQKHLIKSEEDIKHIATISANNDKEIGSIIAEAFSEIGEGGIVSAVGANNRTGKTSIVTSSGMEINKGLLSSYFINTNSNTCELKDPLYLIYGKPLKRLEDIIGIVQIVKRNGQNLVICAPVFEDDFRAAFIEALQKNQITGALIYPNGNDRKSIEDFIEDLAIQVGATVLEGKDKITIDDFDPSTMLGKSELITISKNKTIISGGTCDEEKFNKHLEYLNNEITKGNSDGEGEVKSLSEIEFLKERIANLSGGVATIHIGALSSVELKEKKDRYEDAINAVNAAISEGIIAGGGCGLLHAVQAVSKKHKKLKDLTQERGYQLFLSICEMPAKVIINSTGKKADYLIEKIKNKNNPNYGYNAKVEKLSSDMIRDGVIDPILVTKTALSYATSIAGTFISTNCVIVDEAQNIEVEANDPLLNEDISNIIS